MVKILSILGLAFVAGSKGVPSVCSSFGISWSRALVKREKTWALAGKANWAWGAPKPSARVGYRV